MEQPNGSSAVISGEQTAGGVRLSRPLASLFVGFAVLLSAANLLLIRQSRNLQARLQSVRKELEIQPGNTVPALSGKDPQGNPLVIGYGQDKKQTVLMVFSPECGVCEVNWPNWDRAIRTADANGDRVVGVNLAPALSQKYLDQHGLRDHSVIAEADASAVFGYNLRFTPQTIVVGADGKVQWVWTGVLNREAERAFDAILGRQPQLAEGGGPR